jgi:ribose transport system permease protein
VASRTAFWILLVDLLAVGGFGLASPSFVFLTFASAQDLGVAGAEIVILAVGETMALAAGEIDISLAGNLVLSSVVGGKVMVAISGAGSIGASHTQASIAVGVALGFLAAAATGSAVGLLNGISVAYLKVSSLITTLATAGITLGMALVLTNGVDLTGIPSQVQSGFGDYFVGGAVPVVDVFVLVVVIGIAFVMGATRFGLRTLALGSSREAARRAGFTIERHLIALFMAVGLCGGVTGFLDLARFGSTNLAGHTTDALAAIAGAVIGGTSLFGGRYSIVGSVCGAMLSVILEQGLVVVGVPSFYQQIAVGLVLITAVYVDGRRRHRVSNS